MSSSPQNAPIGAQPAESYETGGGCLMLSLLVLGLVGLSLALVLIFGVPGR